ncbi:MAG: helix-turn-helix transcriptional regulator [Eubacteriales bacterium]|jgi:transcriptional regulator with XRE-family HTH domain|nr:helix-turn-helix transcriptional regulator [Eubacteriales bacterium]MDD3572971.1 helix-turn-helix transcriptional regulator [Eubacteriales bacterium]MDD4134501.1 helix-turn-helix transcriptional regulator [Eubacteriales bacterium]
MEFNTRLQELRKQRGLTQEELAGLLFVSRTAVSKWESGRGFPNIESLKALSRVFQVPVDTLLSGEELLTLADGEAREKAGALAGLVFAILDCMALLLLFLPLFGQKEAGLARAVSLLSLQATVPWVRAAYLGITLSAVLWGLISLSLQAAKRAGAGKRAMAVSFMLTLAGAVAFMAGNHPYAAALMLFVLFTKGILLLKSR